MMSKKGKGAALDSSFPSGVGVFEDAKLRLKHQNLMQEYQELKKEADVTRSRLEAAKQRKLTLVAEVWFLRRRYIFLMETKAMNFSEEQRHVQPLKSGKQAKTMKDQLITRKEANHQLRLAPVSEPKKSMKRPCVAKNVTQPIASPSLEQHRKKLLHSGKESLTPVSVLDHKGRINVRKPIFDWNSPNLDLNRDERMHVRKDSTSTRTHPSFDLNPSGKKASLPVRAPIFDLNEISTGDDDFQSNVEALDFEEAENNLIRGLNDDQQNDLKLSICRNSGEGSSRVGKRKISWQDPVALRV